MCSLLDLERFDDPRYRRSAQGAQTSDVFRARLADDLVPTLENNRIDYVFKAYLAYIVQIVVLFFFLLLRGLCFFL